jgi:hypothetical protein
VIELCITLKRNKHFNDNRALKMPILNTRINIHSTVRVYVIFLHFFFLINYILLELGVAMAQLDINSLCMQIIFRLF